MTNQRRAKPTASKKAAAQPADQPPGQWNLRLTPELREIAGCFHEVLLKICTVEEDEFRQPSIEKLRVRLKFSGPFEGTTAAELVRAIGAASKGNLDADADRFNRLCHNFESLREQADTKGNVTATTSSKRAFDKLLARIYQAQLQLDDLGEPPYRTSENDGTNELPDFTNIWRARERYTMQLSQLEKVSKTLRIDLNQLEPKRPGAPRVIHGLAPFPVELSRKEVTVSVHDLLGGPLAGWVSEIGRSASHTKGLSMEPRWRDLADAYCELHLKSGLMDFEPIDIDGGQENPFWDESRALLSQAHRHLLDFLTVACEGDNPPAAAELVAEAKETRVKKRQAGSSAAEKLGRKIVTIERALVAGSPLKVLVDNVPVRSNAVPTLKGLLAACILGKKYPGVRFLKTVDLKRLVLTGPEFEALEEKAYPQLLDNLTRSLWRPHNIRLEFDEAKHRFRLPNAKFNTSLSIQVIEDALTKFKQEHPIQRRKNKPSS